MCGIAGALDLQGRPRVDPGVVARMTESLFHRGPDSSGLFLRPEVGLGSRRLKIVDLTTGDQPIENEDGSLVLVCNGEIFNYPELRRWLTGRGHVFRTRTDVEVLLHLYEEHGEDLVDHLNGQFAFALWDAKRRRLFLARDHFGVAPLYYTMADGLFLFGSEIKAILAHPSVERRVDLVGLDQVLSLPGLVSPRTVFHGISSLPAGFALTVEDGKTRIRQYWDLDYPEDSNGHLSSSSEAEYVEELREVFTRSVTSRLQADVPVGLFVSGGLDSSLVSAFAARQTPGVPRHTFSMSFEDNAIDETGYQRLMAEMLGSHHHEIRFGSEEIAGRLRDMVYHCECPVKETYNTCALALAGAAREAGVKVVLAGEGADELFGGYPAYRFDAAGRKGPALTVEEVEEEELRERVWGDRHLGYELDQVPLREIKGALYASEVAGRLDEIDCMGHPLVDTSRLRNRHALHKRSYLDFKLRLADHLLSDHGDRMVMAQSVEARYPFLDLEMVDLARRVPPSLKVNGMTEKYLVKRMAEGRIPRSIVEREKFGFRAPGSPMLLRRGYGWVEDLLSPETVRRHGVFDPDAVSRLAGRYRQKGFELHPHLEVDLLMVVLTLHLLCETFEMRGVA